MPPYNPYSSYSLGATGSAIRSFVVAPSDSADLEAVVRGVIIGGAGTVRWRGLDGRVNTTAALPAGFVLPIQADRIFASGTTATELTGLV